MEIDPLPPGLYPVTPSGFIPPMELFRHCFITPDPFTRGGQGGGGLPLHDPFIRGEQTSIYINLFKIPDCKV